jgi:hypothetical protein
MIKKLKNNLFVFMRPILNIIYGLLLFSVYFKTYRPISPNFEKMAFHFPLQIEQIWFFKFY